MTTMPPSTPPTAAQHAPFGYPPPPAQHHQHVPPYAPGRPAAAPADRSWLLGLVSVVAVVVGLSVDENGANQWDRVNAWGGLAIAAALLTLAPLVGRSIGWTAERARQVAGVGAGALVLFWVLFTLPEVGSNTSLVTTVGVGAGAAAVALARP